MVVPKNSYWLKDNIYKYYKNDSYHPILIDNNI